MLSDKEVSLENFKADLLTKIDPVRLSFESQNQFRLLAPESIANGVLRICKDPSNKETYKMAVATMMDILNENVPSEISQETKKDKKGQDVVVQTSKPKYVCNFTEPMLKEVDARFKEISTDSLHQKRLLEVSEFLKSYKPTLSFGDSLYRLSFYLVPSKNNLAKSTNALLSWVTRALQGKANNMLVDSALLIGGQGKSTIQEGLRRAVTKMGFAANMCKIPSISGGIPEVFVSNEFAIDDEAIFTNADYANINKILDKSQVTICGKYVKEWNAQSVANLFVGTNHLPTDINARRYSCRMVNEDFKLIENYGKWTIPGFAGDEFGDSYNKVLDWTEEAWLNLFYYCANYETPILEFEEKSYDYGLLYRIQSALEKEATNEYTINRVVGLIEQSENTTFDTRTKERLKNSLYALANQLKLKKVDQRKGAYSTYDWSPALEIDESFIDDPLEFIYNFFQKSIFNLAEVSEDKIDSVKKNLEKSTENLEAKEFTRISMAEIDIVKLLTGKVKGSARDTLIQEMEKVYKDNLEKLSKS